MRRCAWPRFGCTGGSEAKSILDEAVDTCNTWWKFYERHADKLSDTDYSLQAMRKELNLGIPILRPATFRLKVLLSLVIAFSSVMGRKTAIIDKLAFGDILGWLATGYRMYTSAH
jgi:hypothetical protein